jgi:hypothetical protein
MSGNNAGMLAMSRGIMRAKERGASIMTRITTLILVALLLWASEVRAEEPVKIHTPTGCYAVFDRSGVYEWMEVACVGGTVSAYPFPRCLDTMESAMRAADEFLFDSPITDAVYRSPSAMLRQAADREDRRVVMEQQWNEAKACWRKP